MVCLFASKFCGISHQCVLPSSLYCLAVWSEISGHVIQVRVRDGEVTGVQLSAWGRVLLNLKLNDSGAASCLTVIMMCVFLFTKCVVVLRIFLDGQMRQYFP